MNERLLYEFKIKLFNYCNKYYNISIKTKNNNDKKYYQEIKSIYDDINNLKTYNELVKYIDKLRMLSSLKLDIYASATNFVIEMFDKHINNNWNAYNIKQSIYKLVQTYYETYINNKNTFNKNNYIFISNLYNELRTLNEKELIKYLEDLNQKEEYEPYENVIISKIMQIYNGNLNNKENKRTFKLYNKVLAGRKEQNSEIININELRKNLTNRTKTLNSPTYNMDYFNYLICNVLDHYTVKGIVDNKYLDINQINYLKEIDSQMMSDPYLFFSLPLSNLSNEKLLSYKKYMPNIKTILNNAQKLLIDSQKIERRFYTQEISSIELEKLFRFLSYYITYNRVDNSKFNYESLVKYLFKKDKLTYYEVSFLDKYLGYKNCVENNLIDVEILFGNCDFARYSSRQHVLGIQDRGLILLNKKHIVGTSFKNNSLNKEAVTLLNPFSQVYEGSSQLQTLYHELAHAGQFKDNYENKNSYRAYILSINSIMKEEDVGNEKRNYRYYETESDANMRAFIELEKVLLKYMPHTRVLDSLRAHKNRFNNKLMFNYKIDSNSRRQITGKYEKDIADRYFRKNPDKLKEYPIFRQFYSDNGFPYNLEEMLSKTDFNDEGYYYNQVVGRIYQGEVFTKQNYLNKSQTQRITMIKNINTTLKYINKRLERAIKILNVKLSSIFLDQSGVSKNTLVDYNILVDLKIGNMILKWHENIFKVDPLIKNKIAHLDSKIINDFYVQSKKFIEHEKIIRSMLYSEQRKGMSI